MSETGEETPEPGAPAVEREPGDAVAPRPRPGPPAQRPPLRVTGIFDERPDGSGNLRQVARSLAPSPGDPYVPAPLARRFQLRPGSEVTAEASHEARGPLVRHIHSVDGLSINESRQRRSFKKLTVIDPDFHYELGTCAQDGQLSMRILDLLCPIGRGQRALIVAPPRSGKTILMQQIAHAMEELYPDVHLIVLLVDERPEEATGWKRSVRRGEVYASTLDERPENHVRLAEMVQERAERLVEAGKEVMILLDSLTRLSRAYNHVIGSSGKTLSGGLDARTMARPKAFFGAARNTEEKGALTIIATTLVETGSRMDQVIFEEFKGTGNMELVLDRKLADRRIFPAIAVDRTGTRKEEKLLSRSTLRKVSILRRVLSRMKPLEAMELMVSRLAQFPTNQDFLNAFSLEDVE
ncbi:MAG: transcription termination factor Rho [Planctomycetota bacterium]|nr:MAG: transcription termination factor Rho [Planctomycetota bacterium]